MVLLDKGYFDYDHDSREKEGPAVDWVDTVKSRDELNEMLSWFGIGPSSTGKPETLDDIQKHIIEQERYGS